MAPRLPESNVSYLLALGEADEGTRSTSRPKTIMAGFSPPLSPASPPSCAGRAPVRGTGSRGATTDPGHPDRFRTGGVRDAPRSRVSRPPYPHAVGIRHDHRGLQSHRCGLQSPGHPRRGSLVVPHARGPDHAKKALASIEELRDFIQVVDITQLYYTPDLYNPDPANSLSSLNLDSTYLLFCTELLTPISNLAPLYTRGAAGDSILRAVSDVEMLANATSAKLRPRRTRSGSCRHRAERLHRSGSNVP